MNTLTYQPFCVLKKILKVRYDYNFAQIGVLGLNLMARYASGDNFKIGGKSGKNGSAILISATPFSLAR